MLCPSCKAENEDAAEACFTCGQALGSARALRKGSVVASRYEILSLLGQGGMGAVYRAHDRLLDEPVAIKVLRPDVAREPDIARRFQSEIKLARRVSHKNVCRIHEYGEDQGLRYISMEFLEGVDLRQLVRERGGLPPADGLDTALQICDGLAAIHEVGVIHRDLKTPNIMRDKRGLIRLMDFGIAKESGVDGTATATGLIIGTPEYMSPEQARGEKIDFRSDIYALGIVIFEIFTGRVPFRSETPLGIILKHLQQPPPLDGPEAAALPDAVKDVLRCALAKTPGERYGTVSQMADALRQARAVALGQATGSPPAFAAPPAPPSVPSPTASAPSATATSAPTMERAYTAPAASTPAAATARPPSTVPAARPAWTAMPPAPRRGLSPLVLVLAGVGLAGVVLVGLVVVGASLFGGPKGTPEASVAPPPEAPAAVPRSTPAPPAPTPPAVGTPEVDPTPTDVADGGPTRAAQPEPMRPVDRPPARSNDRAPSQPVASTPARRADPATPAPAATIPAAVVGPLASLGARDANERWHAAEALGNLGGEAKAAVPALMASLGDRSEVVRWRSAEALGKIGPEAAPAVASLKAALADPDGLVKTEAAKALGKIGAPAGAAAGALADTLRSSDAFLRREAAKALVKIVGPESREAVQALSDGLKDKDKFVRMECARALGRIGPEARAAVPALTGALNDKEPLVAKEADDALRNIGGARP